MNDPKRLLQEPWRISAVARALVTAGRNIQPEPGVRARSWAEFLKACAREPFNPGSTDGGTSGPANGAGGCNAGSGGMSTTAGGLGALSAPFSGNQSAMAVASDDELGSTAMVDNRATTLGLVRGSNSAPILRLVASTAMEGEAADLSVVSKLIDDGRAVEALTLLERDLARFPESDVAHERQRLFFEALLHCSFEESVLFYRRYQDLLASVTRSSNKILTAG